VVPAKKLFALSIRCLVLCLTLFLGTAVRAQVEIKYFHPEKFERATKADDKGMEQWAEHAKVECPTCSGTGKTKCSTCDGFSEDATFCIECKRTKEREVPCRACGGTGSFPDPLEKVLCPGCRGAGFLVCMFCGGGGRLKIDKDKQWSACPGCRGEGGFKCASCNGSRLVEVAGLKPSLKEANAATLGKAMTPTEQALKDLDAFAPTGGEVAVRKEVKQLVKILEGVQAIHPAIKRLIKPFEDYMSKTYGGQQFQGHEEKYANAMKLVKDNTAFYLKHQKRMMELCLKRAEANEKLAGANKSK
jgi:hypothetical protein